MLKKILFIIFTISILGCASAIYADTGKVLTGSVVAVPDSFWGTWRVVSKLIDTNSPNIFKENNIDLWNISGVGNVITLKNPFNGACADITIDSASENHVVFKKTGKYDQKILTDTVEINLAPDTFKGIDTIQLDTYSDVDGKLIKSETAKYSISAERIAGQSNPKK